MRRRRIFAVGMVVISILLMLVIPFSTEVSPEWEVQFMDQVGTPVSGVGVEQVCYHYTYSFENLCSAESDSIQTSDEVGKVRFPRRIVRLPLVYRFVRGVFAYLTLIAHGSVGTDSYLIVIVPNEYQSLGALLTNEGAGSVQVVTLKRDAVQVD